MNIPHGKSGPWQAVTDPNFPCRKCHQAGRIEVSIWISDDEAFEDFHYRCLACGHNWWIDGIDS